VWCKICVSHVDFIIVGVCYRSPDADDGEKDQLFECISLVTNYNHPVLIMEILIIQAHLDPI